jgi:hypothetical protein
VVRPSVTRLAAALARSPAGAAAIVLGAAAGLAARGSLLEVPGFELGMAGALGSAVLGAALGIAAARRELAGPGPEPARAALAASLVLSLALALLFGASAARAALLTPCRAAAAADLFWLTALPSALLAAALGTASAFVARGGRLRSALLCAAAALGSLGATLWRAWSGPSASAFDHLLGWWPGPVYDEALAADSRLLLFRVGTLAWAAALVSAAALVVRRRAARPAGGALAALALSLCAALLARAAGGVDPDRAAVAEALGGEREGKRCALRFPREWTPAQAERLARDCEAAAAEVAHRLGLEHPPRARVFVYRSPEEKRRLVGAGRTSFTKPWLAEIHVNDEPSPRPVLRHELVHAVASSLAGGPLRVPARGVVLVRAGLVEGLAAALEPPRGDFTAHEWARAMRDLGLLPPPAALLGSAGFLGQAPARAYAAAGSFVAFLLERHGPAAVRALYGTGSWPGRDPGDLAAEWSRFLDGVAVPPGLAAAAALRFRDPGLLARACGREQASLAEEAGRAARAGQVERAEAAWRRVSSLAGGDPAPLLDAARAWRERDPARSATLCVEALDRAGAGFPPLRAAALAALGDLDLAAGRGPAAAERYRAALSLGAEGSEARALEARLAAAADPALAAAAGPWLLGEGDQALALARLGGSPAPLGRYLLARAALARGAPRLALSALRGLAGALPGERLQAEARRMEGEALCGAGDFPAAVRAFGAIAASAGREAERDRAGDAARRCAFEGQEYGKGVEWPGDALPAPPGPGESPTP